METDGVKQLWSFPIHNCQVRKDSIRYVAELSTMIDQCLSISTQLDVSIINSLRFSIGKNWTNIRRVKAKTKIWIHLGKMGKSQFESVLTFPICLNCIIYCNVKYIQDIFMAKLQKIAYN